MLISLQSLAVAQIFVFHFVDICVSYTKLVKLNQQLFSKSLQFAQCWAKNLG